VSPDRRDHDDPLPSAGEDVARADQIPATPQTSSPSHRLAFADPELMLRRELRPVRLQLEYLKPDLILADHRIESTVVVFGSARLPTPLDGAAPPGVAAGRLDKQRAYAEAREFGRLVSLAGQKHTGQSRRFVVVTGGGPGIMEAANRGAADVGAESIGLNIVLPREQAPNPYITPALCFQFHYFALRKLHFMLRAQAMVFFPGGYGTLDELFEALTLIQTGKAEPMPLLLFDEAYWRRIINFEAMAEEGVIASSDLELFRYVESAGEAWRLICEHYRLPQAEPHLP
jgi:uncharacterized protein (TIGR00730 family)